MPSSSGNCQNESNGLLKTTHNGRRGETDSDYQSKKWKPFDEWPQVLACLSVALFHLPAGISLGYSSILIPQLESQESDLPVDKEQSSWIVSVYTLASMFGVLFVGYIVDRVGRLSTLSVGVVPNVLGWGCIALAPDVQILLVGRVLTSIAHAMQCMPSPVYISEIVSPELRGTMSCLSSCFFSLGLITTYTAGALVHWRTVAWLAILPCLLPLALLTPFATESPIWLVSQGKHKDAEKSLRFLLRSFKKPEKVEHQVKHLLKDQMKNQKESNMSSVMKLMRGLALPTGFKPFLLLFVLFVFQQASGTLIILTYGVSLFQAVGSTVDPYVCTVGVGVIKLVFVLVTAILLKRCGRRPLFMFSASAMSVFMLIAGFVLKEVTDGKMEANFIPAACLLLYLSVSVCGMISIPWTMTAELFTLEIRGMATGLISALAGLLMSAVVKIYPFLPELVGGLHCVLWLFSGVSFTAALFVLVFLPETHNKTLAEIQEYFRHNTVYLLSRRAQAKKESKYVRLETI